MKLKEFCSYRNESVDSKSIDPEAFVSTESMLPNKAGIKHAENIPTSGNVRVYRKGDTLISNIRPYFRKIWQATKDGACSPDVLVFSPEKCASDYLYWLLSDNSFFDYVAKTSKGTKMPRGDKSAIMDFDIREASEEDQLAIASVLDPIRHKIALNNRLNGYLEGLGQALLKRYYDSCPTACELKQIMDFGNGFAFKSSTYVDEGLYKVLTIKNVQDGSVDCSAASRIDEIPAKMKDYCKLSPGDVVLSLTGNVGRVGIVAEENCLLNQRVAVLQPKDSNLLPALYFIFRNKAFQNEMIGIARGTAQANLSPIEMLQLAIPYDKEALTNLSKTLAPIFATILQSKLETWRLSGVRDSLLPKLMSGEVDVSQIELPTRLNSHLADIGMYAERCLFEVLTVILPILQDAIIFKN